MKKKPNISRQAFWNIEFESIDFEKNSHDVICRILNHGNDADYKEIVSFYGKDEVLRVIQLEFDDIEMRKKLFSIIEIDRFTKNKIDRLNQRKYAIEKHEAKQAERGKIIYKSYAKENNLLDENGNYIFKDIPPTILD
jgi:hypothetical protein